MVSFPGIAFRVVCQPVVAMFIVLVLAAQPLFAQDHWLGEIRWVPYSFAPKGWAFCDGQIMAIPQNTALYSLLGTTYGGNGITTFALPDMRAGGSNPHDNMQPFLGIHCIIALDGLFPERN